MSSSLPRLQHKANTGDKTYGEIARFVFAVVVTAVFEVRRKGRVEKRAANTRKQHVGMEHAQMHEWEFASAVVHR